MTFDRLGPNELRVAIQGVCAWPRLVGFADGTVVATLFNQPCHGRWEGDLDCWATLDNGEIWNFQGRACPHEPGKNRMNCAVGLTKGETMIVLCSGWNNRVPPFTPYRPFSESHILRAWACRSTDQGKTWERIGELPDGPGGAVFTPFGAIRTAADGSLRAAASVHESGDKRVASYMLSSSDQGATWRVLSRISDDGNETSLLDLSPGRWLAAVRTPGRVLNLFESRDDGASWSFSQPLSLPYQITGDLVRLADGRILACYGNRCPNNSGVDARLSPDEGATWTEPIRLAHMRDGDGGYPSSVQLPDGRLLTAYYEKLSGAYNYQMSTVTWDPRHYDRKRDPAT